MIIDVHSHIAYDKIYPQPYLTGMLSGSEFRLPEEKLSSLLSTLLNDRSCDQFVKQMDLAGVVKSVLLIIDGGLGMAEAPLPLEEIFLLHREVLLKYPDRFIVFAGVDPRRGEFGLNLFKTSIDEYGFKGLKLYPPMGYKASDPLLNDYYKICEENNLAVLIHTGPSLKVLQNELADPKYIYNTACSFTGVNFILAHAGYNLENPAIDRLLHLPNVFFDIAGFQSLTKTGNMLHDKIELLFTEKYNSKVLFGSDWPLFNMMSPISKHINVIKDFYLQYPDKVHNGLENLFYNNALKALRLLN